MKVTIEGALIVMAGAALGAVLLGLLSPYTVQPIQRAIASSKTA